jgi:hypothetical protein
MMPHRKLSDCSRLHSFSLESVCKIANSTMSDFSTRRSEIAAEISELCRRQSLAEQMKVAGWDLRELIAYQERMNRLAELRSRLKQWGAQEVWSQNWP